MSAGMMFMGWRWYKVRVEEDQEVVIEVRLRF